MQEGLRNCVISDCYDNDVIIGNDRICTSTIIIWKIFIIMLMYSAKVEDPFHNCYVNGTASFLYSEPLL